MCARSGLIARFATSKDPEVSGAAVPPAEGKAYSCSQPVFSQGKTSVPPCIHSRLLSESVGWKMLPGPASALQTLCAWPLAASATQIDHGSPLRRDTNSGPLCAGTRMKATCEPVGEKTGELS